MLRLIIIIIIDFYTPILKKNIGAKEKIQNKIITIKPNNWKKTLTPIRKCIKSLQTCKTERYVTTVDEAPVCTVAEYF